MELQLDGKRVLVTGASKGIGLATVRAFVAEGATVFAASRTETPELKATGATFVAADLSTADGPRTMVEAVLAAGTGLDVLVNNAGGGDMPAEAFGDSLDGEDDVWAMSFALTLSSAVRVTRAALPAIAESRGAIVNVGSDSARRMGAEPLHYAAAKAALARFTRGLAEKLGPAGVRVNLVSPSATRTTMVEGDDGFLARVAAASGTERETVAAALPGANGMLTGALIEPDEIARTILLLASPAMPSVMGADWAVNAGSIKVA
jgi:NAD(P)-dependent dehydrogenase (short-subunit alcohol dehydrogenase family)